jgi:hypothetical protein
MEFAWYRKVNQENPRLWKSYMEANRESGNLLDTLPTSFCTRHVQTCAIIDSKKSKIIADAGNAQLFYTHSWHISKTFSFMCWSSCCEIEQNFLSGIFLKAISWIHFCGDSSNLFHPIYLQWALSVFLWSSLSSNDTVCLHLSFDHMQFSICNGNILKFRLQSSTYLSHITTFQTDAVHSI